MTSPFLSQPLRTRAQVERDEIEASGARVTEIRRAPDAPLPDDFEIPAYLRRPAPRRDFDEVQRLGVYRMLRAYFGGRS